MLILIHEMDAINAIINGGIGSNAPKGHDVWKEIQTLQGLMILKGRNI